jgi:serine/threonine protein kinase
MIRCPGCGRRLADSDPRCPAHGAVPARSPADESPPTAITPPDIAGYAIGRLLGQGGFGAVFKAERLSDHRQVALKVARADNPAAGESLLREVAALSAVGPPAVPEVYENGALTDGAPFVAM